MNYRTKDELKNQIGLIKKIYANVFVLIESEDVMTLLEKCQSIAINVGGVLEENGELDSVHLLEEFCENLYRITIANDENDIVKLRTDGCKLLERIDQGVESINATKRIAFLPYKASMWDALESVWLAFSKDSRFECVVLPIPYYEANLETKEWIPKYEGDIFPSYVPVVHYNDYDLESMHSDVIFVHNPYDDTNIVTSVHPHFFSDKLKKYAEKLVYIPYYLNMGFTSFYQRELPVHVNMDYMIVQNERAKDNCKEYIYYEKILALGSPKFDKIVSVSKDGPVIPEAWKDIIEGKKTVLLNTTIQELLDNGDSTFSKLKSLFKFAESRTEKLAIIWRPHPLLMATIMSMRLELKDKYLRLIQEFKEKGIGILDETPDFINSIVISDGYIGSNVGSALIPYQVLGKPVYRLKPQGVAHDEDALKNKEKAPYCYYYRDAEWDYFSARESLDYTIEMYLDDIIEGRLDDLKEKQIAAIQDINASFDGKCGERIYEFFRDLLLKEENQ